MKKLFVLFLAAMMALSFSCVSYAEETAENTDETADETATEENADTDLWAVTDEEGLYDALGFGFTVPDAAEDLQYNMDETDKIGEMTFTLDGNSYTARIANTTETENVPDISEMNYTWTTEQEGTFNDMPCMYMETEDGDNTAAVLTWLDAENGIAYSLATVQSGVGEDALQAVAAQVYSPVTAAAEN